MPYARRIAAVGFLVCLQTIGACSSRPSGGTTASPQPPPDPATAVASGAEPTPSTTTTAAAHADPDPCIVLAPSSDPIATVALGEPVSPSNAPRPSNESERLLFRQMYETLVRADCTGRVVPGLAASWTLDSDGRTWLVTLRDAAYFSDGTLVTAADVRATWIRDGRDDHLHPHVNALIESIVAIGDRTLAIRPRNPGMNVPLALAHSDLAVAKAVAGSEWPLGTRGARIAPDAGIVPAVASSAIVLVRDDRPPIRFLVARGDHRDLLDDGVDLLLTRDPATLEYAATLRQFESVPLAWQRLYVLLVPGRSRDAPPVPAHARHTLAADAVRGEARGAEGPFWWQELPDCAVPAPAQRHEQGSFIPRLVYDARDAVARDLAERFVGLNRTPAAGGAAILGALVPDRTRRSFDRAAGLTGTAFAAAGRRGADVGYVIALDNRPLEPCQSLRALQASVPWLDPGTIVPLVETRLRALVRRGAGGITAEWDGALLIGGPDTR